jgi:pyruvate dehydrogenase E2 component (dihydrolipoamide acetyltransferase)
LTISNLSMHPIQSFNAVIPPGQSAALAIGAVEETPVCRNGQVTTAPIASVTLTADHRIINGQEAARFLARLKEFMEAL